MRAGIRILVALAAALAIIGITVVGLVKTANAAVGDNLPKKCQGYGDKHKYVTVQEWRHITFDITHKELVALLDGPGTKQKGNLPGYWYPICGMQPRHGRVIVTYDHGEPSTVMWFEVTGGEILGKHLS